MISHRGGPRGVSELCARRGERPIFDPDPGRHIEQLEHSMRVLFTGCPAYGHVNTMLPLARQAQHAGHEVAFATGAEMVPELERRGFDSWLVGPSRAETDASVRAAHPDLEAIPPEQRLPVQIQGVFVESAAKRAIELVPRAQQWKPDIVVHEFTELAGALAAAHTGARHIVHGLGLMPSVQMWDALFGSGFARLCREWDVPELTEGLKLATYLNIRPPSLRTDGEVGWQLIQPLRPAAGEPAPGERLPAALAALPYLQTIHLTLGTIFHEAPGVLETAIAGLRELPLNLVVTSGPGTEPAQFGPQPPHVLIEPYIPHSLLLPHCNLVVAHGGAGIMLSALAHGLPQLILPQGADQFMNAATCQSAGAALVLQPDELSADAVAAATERLLTQRGFATAAGRIRAEIGAMPTAAAVLPALLSSELVARGRWP
ncbi:MAG: glycosyltransferase [Pseudonocardiaceae bacterium]